MLEISASNFIEDWNFETLLLLLTAITTPLVSILSLVFVQIEMRSKSDKRTILETFYTKMRKVFKSCGIRDFVPGIIWIRTMVRGWANDMRLFKWNLLAIPIEQLKILLPENCSNFDFHGICVYLFLRNNKPFYFYIKFKWFRMISKFISLVSFYLFIYCSR